MLIYTNIKFSRTDNGNSPEIIHFETWAWSWSWTWKALWTRGQVLCMLCSTM